MKNYEKYADEIREFDGKHFCQHFIKPNILGKDSCIDIGCARCNTLQMLWMLEDYKEPETDWSKVEVDTPILVRDYEGQEWARRYFAKFEDGIVYAWDSGQTSWTAHNMITTWEYAKLAEGEDE